MNAISNGRFLRHGPCDKCGSKDNVAWYDSGTGFCFGCGAFYTASKLENLSLGQRTHGQPKVGGSGRTEGGILSSGIRPPPADCNHDYPRKVMEWVGKYELEAKDLIKHNVMWSPSREQLIYIFYGEGADVVLWQARNFRDGVDHKHRFFTSGSPAAVIAEYRQGEGCRKGVLVEDCVSAIKVAMSGCGNGIPCFSAALSTDKIVRLSKLYEEMVVWLDEDKFGEAVKLSNRFKLLNVKSRVVHTVFDPKEYNLYEVGTILHG